METSTSAEEPAGDFQVYQLTPLSELAKSFKGPKYGSTLAIAPQGSIRIGRNVRPSEGYCLPAKWVQVSSSHCRIFWDPEVGGYAVTDTSTNGTYVNAVRVPKGGSCPLKPGDLLNLSVAPEQDPSKALE
jgi:pSer/pThr/pTyr-binding forkhead associated (FHA) protein